MNFTQLQARAAVLASFEGWGDVSPAPAWDVLVNQAWDRFSWDGECVVGTTTFPTVGGQAAYALAGEWKRIMDVVYDTAGANVPVRRSKEEYERFTRADWRVQPPGTPARWTFNPINALTLIPPPSVVRTVSVRGITKGTALAAGGDIPVAPVVCHEGIALMAAYLQGEIYAQGEGMDCLNAFLKEHNYDYYVELALKYANYEEGGY